MNTEFVIEGKRVGGDAPTYIVAELSANHGGKLQIAIDTIKAAAEAGADAIKVQTYTPDTLTLKSDAAPFVVRTKNAWAGRTLHDLYAEAMTPWEWHRDLRDAAHAAGLAFFSTPFDATAAEFLDQLGAPTFKIASFELTDLPLVEHVARRGKPIIMSTGMASLGEIEAAVRACRAAGNDQIALLRCVSAYPAAPASMHLRSLPMLTAFGTIVGLSDHTRDATVAIASVALGAKIIEKHFILDRAVGGPDSFFSLEPSEFRTMVQAVRATEAALGAPRFGPSEEERASVAFRRSLFVARDVAEGAVLTCDDVRSVRPSFGLAAEHLPEVLGRKASRALRAATPLEWSAVGARPSSGAITLRPATADDAAVLLHWRNDPLTRKMSLNQGEVSETEHRAWLANVLSADGDGKTSLWIAERGAEPIGQVRFDQGEARTAEVSITLAPEVRGEKLSPAVLAAAEETARKLGNLRIVARIRQENERSIRAFKSAGYYAFVSREGASGTFVWCERRLSRFSSAE